MIDSYEIYEDCLDRISQDENGTFTVGQFNRMSWIGQLRCIDWLSGSVEGNIPPELANTQKNRDFISDFIVKYPKQVEGGKIVKPDDYYLYQTGYKINGVIDNTPCEGEEEPEDDDAYTVVADTTITLLDVSKFNQRIDTYIEALKPTVNKAICKMVGKDIIFAPADLGSIAIEYIRYPKKAVLVMKNDEEYNEPVYDKEKSTPFEWGEYARPMLVSFICQEFYNNTRDSLGMQMNQATPKLSRT